MSVLRFALPPRPSARWLPCILALLSACLAVPSTLQAQCTRNPDGTFNCPTGEEPGIDAPPVINIQPGSADVAQPAVAVTISMRDDWELIQSTFQVTLTTPAGTQDVTSQFSFGKTPDERNQVYRMRATATGAVALSPVGAAQLTARICDATDELRCTTSAPAVFRMSLPGVEVTPDAQFFATVSSPAAKTHAFAIANRGTENATFALAVECRDEDGDAVSGCGVQSSVAVAAGASASVNVTYPASQLRVISVVVSARHTQEKGVEDAGWAEITVRTAVGTTQVAPQVSAVALNAGSTIERSQCVTVSTALRGAYECGDLRVVHGLPAHRTYNRAWAPVLVYNSQHAHPTPTVYADVTLPGNSKQPDSVKVIVRMRDGAVYQARYPGSEFLPGMTRRVGVQWDGLGATTGVYGYTLQVVNQYGTTLLASDTLPGELAVVNRKESVFGAGWWLAGWEQFACIDCYSATQRRLWIGGDGSTRVYTSTPGGGTWFATNPDGPPDSIVQMPNGLYRRPLRGGGFIEFNNQGEHLRTVNRLGQATAFDVQGNRLLGITVPVPSGTAPGWTFAYESFGSGAWRLKTVTATAPGAASRTVTLAHGGGDWRVSGITDPDGLGVAFAYPTGTYLRRINRQRDRRETWTYYGYDAGGRLNAARTQMGATADATRDLSTAFVAAESRGVAQAGAAGTSVSSSAVYTRLDGPRPAAEAIDHTYLWLNPDGTIRRVRNPVGAETRIRYGDPRFPALATEVTSPGGMYTRAWYDDEGRPVTSTVFGQYLPTESSTTHTAWDPVCHKPTMVTSTVADTTWIEYDPATCNPRWQRLGRDTARTVTFEYYGAGTTHAGMVKAVIGPRDAEGRRAREEVEYDARGNLRLTRDPLGFISVYETDALGRDTAVYTPIFGNDSSRIETLLKQTGARQTIHYDVAGRPDSTVSYGPAITHIESNGPGTTPSEQLTVVTTYDGEGSPLTVNRIVTPNPAGLQTQRTRYQYDAAGRKTDEWSNDLLHQEWRYDQGGNAVQAITARGDTITSRYDAADRLVRRIVPSVEYAQLPGTCPVDRFSPYAGQCAGMVFPIFPNRGTSYVIPEEWTTYRYDLVGNMVRAENGDAVVTRTYYPNGQIRTDSTAIRDFSAENAFSQVFGIEYGYNEGRLTRVIHPGNLAGTDMIDKFEYHPQTGALAAAEDRIGNVFGFNHDFAERLTGMSMPGGITDTRWYDGAGRLRSRQELAGTTLLLSETYAYDARDKLLKITVPGASSYEQWYSGLGNLAMTDWSNVGDPQFQREGFATDPLGNVVQKHVFDSGQDGPYDDHPDLFYELDTALGRVMRIGRVDTQNNPGDPYISGVRRDDTFQGFDNSGNLISSFQGIIGPNPSDGSYSLQRRVSSRSYYGADDRLRVVQQYNDQPGPSQAVSRGLWEEYRYDPLGRRVGVRTLRPGALCNQPDCFDTWTYYVWLGDQILWELRTTPATAPEQTRGQVSYFHAGGIDRPLTVWKSGVGSVVTHQNWRGQLARGTFGEGTGRVGQSTECPELPPTNGCIPVAWPGWNTNAWNEETAKPNTTGEEDYWFGSLAVGMRDASGMLYMRNRYYNPQTGQFTQPDPIGLAGGLNSYGFAAGDPVSYSDPYGLSAQSACPPLCNELNPRHLEIEVDRAENATLGEALAGGVVLLAVSAVVLAPEALPAFGAGARRLWSRLRGTADDVAPTGGRVLTREQQRTIRSLESRIREHQGKLDAYRRNPDAFDNRGILRNAPNAAVRDRIIQGRIRHLESEIRGWQRQIDDLQR
jgi:RHS repeat-associated protein